MKKRSFEQRVKDSRKAILKENEEWFHSFMEESYPGFQERKEKVQSKKRKTAWISFSSAAAAIAVIIGFIFLWPLMFPTPVPEPGKHYLLENETTVNSDLIELNADLQSLSVMPAENCQIEVKRVYDSESGDTLSYYIRLTNDEAIETVEMYLYVNLNYENRQKIDDIIEKTSVGGFAISYKKTAIDDEWFFTLKYYAIAECGDFAVYIEYEQLSLDETGTFFDFFAQTFQTN